MIALDLLGLGHPKWPIKATIKALRDLVAAHPGEKLAIGMFTDPKLFGPKAIVHTRKILQKVPDVVVVRGQLLYTANHRLNTIKEMRPQLVKWEPLTDEFIMPSFYMSHTTEHREQSKDKLINLMEDIRAFGFSPVNNPLPQGAKVPVFNETHDWRKEFEFVSMDGMGDKKFANGALDIDCLKWLKTHEAAKYRFVWCSYFNMRKPGSAYVVPSKRTEGPPDWKYIVAIGEMGIVPADAPAKVAGMKPVDKPCLYKTMSDDTPGSRLFKPVFITKNKYRYFEILNRDMDQIGRLMYYGTYTGGLHRYYSGLPGGIGLWGYEIARKALKTSGSPWIALRAEKELYGWIHPAFRWGYFRA